MKTIAEKIPIWLIVVSGATVIGVLVLDLFAPTTLASEMFYVGLVLVSLWWPHKQSVLIATLVSIILLIFGVVLSDLRGDWWYEITNRGIALLAIGVTALLCSQRKKIEETLRQSNENLQQQITERKRAEEALRESEQQLRELNASKDKFFSILAHDLKNPLASFVVYVNLLENFAERGAEERKKLIQMFKVSAENLCGLLENLLTWARIQQGRLAPSLRQISIWPIVAQNVKLLTPNASQKQIMLNNLVPQECSVSADFDMLNTVVRNLLANAIKFTNTGGAVSIAGIPDGDMVKVVVSDTGIGIPVEKLSNLFRIDAKYQRAGTAGEKGTGLGLILCKEFVEKQGGHIWAESEVGKGSTFAFTLLKV
jgi:signal transduction histidine kinase